MEVSDVLRLAREGLPIDAIAAAREVTEYVHPQSLVDLVLLGATSAALALAPRVRARDVMMLDIARLDRLGARDVANALSRKNRC